MNALKWPACVCLSVSLIILALCLSVFLPTFSTGFYIREYEKYSLSDRIGVSREDLKTVTKNLQRYMMGLDEELDATVPIKGETRAFFNEKEKAHMVDVKLMFDFGFRLMWGAAAVFAVSGVFVLFKRYLRQAVKAIAVVTGSVLALFGTMALIIALNFNRAFIMFHEIFFTNDLWQLDPRKDLLINLVPQEFFIDISKTIAICFLGTLAVLFVVCLISNKRLTAGKTGR